MPRAAKAPARVRSKNVRGGGKAAKPAKSRSRPAKKTPATVIEPPAATAVATVTLPDCLDASAAGAIRTMLLERRGSPLVVDASQVRRAGTQALQVLLSAARTWQSDAMTYALANPSPEFLDTIALAGLPPQSLLLEGSSP